MQCVIHFTVEKAVHCRWRIEDNSSQISLDIADFRCISSHAEQYVFDARGIYLHNSALYKRWCLATVNHPVRIRLVMTVIIFSYAYWSVYIWTCFNTLALDSLIFSSYSSQIARQLIKAVSEMITILKTEINHESLIFSNLSSIFATLFLFHLL